jgi:hypothetical protein
MIKYLNEQLDIVLENLDPSNIYHILDTMSLLILKINNDIVDSEIDKKFSLIINKIVDFYPEYNYLKDFNRKEINNDDVNHLLKYYISEQLIRKQECKIK